jgi:predicted metal-dependent peptidase
MTNLDIEGITISKIDPALFYLFQSVKITRNVKTEEIAYATLKGIVLGERFFSMNTSERCFVLLHELLHILLDHVPRSINKNAKIFNIAADYIVNNILLTMNKFEIRSIDPIFSLKEYGIDDDEWKSSSVENIYYKLLKQPECLEMQSGCSDNHSDIHPDDAQTEGEIIREGDPEFTKAATDEERREVIKKIISQFSSEQGSLKRIIEKLYFPQLDWKSILRDRLTAKINATASTWKVPNRRFKDMPSVKKTGIANCWVFIDNSGSISDKDLKTFLSEVSGIIKSKTTSNITVVFWSIGLDREIKIKTPQDVTKIKGIDSKGGTHFFPCYNMYRGRMKPSDITIILSDFDVPSDDITLFKKNREWILVTTENKLTRKTIVLK